MILPRFKISSLNLVPCPRWRHFVLTCLTLVLGLSCWLGSPPAAFAGLNDDRFEGNIFALYGGNGSLVPPKVTLAESFQRQKPVLLIFFLDDSRDCKQFSSVVSQLQAFYGRVANLIPVNIDSIPIKASYDPTEPGYYYKGLVPQTVLLDQSGKVVLDVNGQVPFERVDDVFRQVFDLVPRSESTELKRRRVNELNTELTR